MAYTVWLTIFKARVPGEYETFQDALEVGLNTHFSFSIKENGVEIGHYDHVLGWIKTNDSTDVTTEKL